MKPWEHKVLGLLDKSLGTIPVELNELDWKSHLSTNSEKLAKHISAFCHLPQGGFLVYGINNDGSFGPQLAKTEVDEIVKKLGNIAQNNLAHSITIDYAILQYRSHTLLVVYIPECSFKPVHLRGRDLFDCYKRSAGQTVKQSPSEVHALIARSQHTSFESQIAAHNVTTDEVFDMLNYDAFSTLWQEAARQ